MKLHNIIPSIVILGLSLVFCYLIMQNIEESLNKQFIEYQEVIDQRIDSLERIPIQQRDTLIVVPQQPIINITIPKNV